MAKQNKGLTLSLEDVSVEHMNITAVAQEDGDAALHDTVKVLAVLTENKLSDTFARMGITKTQFMKNGPDEVPKVAMISRYEGHKATLSGGFGGDNLVASIEEAELVDFRVERLAADSYQLTFKVKGMPDQDSHVNFENAWLDSLTGVRFDLAIEPPAQKDLDLENNKKSNAKDKEKEGAKAPA